MKFLKFTLSFAQPIPKLLYSDLSSTFFSFYRSKLISLTEFPDSVYFSFSDNRNLPPYVPHSFFLHLFSLSVLINQSIYLIIYLSIQPSINPSIHRSKYLSMNFSTNPLLTTFASIPSNSHSLYSSFTRRFSLITFISKYSSV